MKHYFITGATGAIGAALVPLLLQDRDNTVSLLIRAENQGHLQDRLEELYAFWAFEKDDDRRQRVTGIIGDISQLRFGMDDDTYARISGRCTHIIHCAGNVRMNLPLEAARECSVDSARNVVALAEASLKTLEKVEFVSTVGVGGRMPGIVPETWIDAERDFHNTYEQAKAEAEDYIREQTEKGLPVTVHRPSMVVGDSKTGKIIHFQIFYHLCEFLSGKRTLGVVPDTGGAKLDTIPADYVAKIIAWASMNRETSGRVLHECSGPEHSLKISDLGERVRRAFQVKEKYGIRTIQIPVWLFKAALPVIGLLVPARSKRAMKALPVFFDYLSSDQGFDNRKTREILEGNLRFPHVDEYLGNVLDCYLEKDK